MVVGETGRAIRIVAGGLIALVCAATVVLALGAAWYVAGEADFYPTSAVDRWKVMAVSVVAVGIIVPVVLWRLRRPTRVAGRVVIALVATATTAVVGVWLAMAPIKLSSDDLSRMAWPQEINRVLSWKGTDDPLTSHMLNNRIEQQVVVLAMEGPGDDAVETVAHHLAGQGWDLGRFEANGDIEWLGDYQGDPARITSRAD